VLLTISFDIEHLFQWQGHAVMEQQLDYQTQYLTMEDDAYLSEMNKRISRLHALHQKASFRPDTWQWLNDLKKQA